LRPVFPATRVQHISELHPKFALRPHHVWKYGIDIHSATAEIRRGKKEERTRRKKKKKEKEETTGQNIMSASATQGGHKKRFVFRDSGDRCVPSYAERSGLSIG